MAASKFDPAKSAVANDTLAHFVAARIDDDITTVPGIASKNAAVLARVGVRSVYQLIGEFLFLRAKRMTTRQHCVRGVM